jgi:hypothetical protein
MFTLILTVGKASNLMICELSRIENDYTGEVITADEKNPVYAGFVVNGKRLTMFTNKHERILKFDKHDMNNHGVKYTSYRTGNAKLYITIYKNYEKGVRVLVFGDSIKDISVIDYVGCKKADD